MKSLSKRTFACLGLALAGVIAGLTPQADAQDWIHQFGTSSNDYVEALAPDGAGGVLVAGSTRGSLGRPHSGGDYDAFLARYNSAGNRVWIRQFGTSNNDHAYAVVSDRTGGAIVAGDTASADVFLARYDSMGDQLWIRTFDSGSGEHAFALAPDGAGGVMVAGQTYGDLAGRNAGGWDAFLARYDGAGNLLWIQQFGTIDYDYAYGLAPDGAGGVMVAGWTGGSLGGPNAGGIDAYLARYDSAGNRLWIRQFGTSRYDYARALASDGAGGVLVAGTTEGSLGGPHSGRRDAYLARYDGAGDLLWIRQFGTGADDYASSLAPDGAGGVLVAGFTGGSLGATNRGNNDAFLAHYDSTGGQLWISQFGASSDDYAKGVATDGAGGVLIAGWTDGSLGGPNAGGTDAFLARFSVNALPGDLNCDDRFDGGDIDPFFLALGDPPAYQIAFPNCDPLLGDMNSDGRLDGGDIDPFFACLGGGACP